jgi:hypothetical protein
VIKLSDPPPTLGAILAESEEQHSRYATSQRREADALLEALGDREAVVDLIAAEWVPRVLEGAEINLPLPTWIDAGRDRPELSRFATWTSGPGTALAHSQLAGEAVGKYVLARDAGSWRLYSAALGPLTSEGIEAFASTLRNAAIRDAALREQVHAALRSWSVATDDWVRPYRDDRAAVGALAEEWKRERDAGVVGEDRVYVPTRSAPALVLDVLRTLSLDDWFALVDALPLPQIVDDVISVSMRREDLGGALEMLAQVPSFPEPRLHAATIVLVRRAIEHLLRILQTLTGKLRSASGGEQRRRAEVALEEFDEWASKAYLDIATCIRARPDGPRILMAFSGRYLDEALSLALQERAEKRWINLHIVAAVQLGRSAPSVPENMMVGRVRPGTDGRLMSILLRALLARGADGKSTIEMAVAHALWEAWVELLEVGAIGVATVSGVTNPLTTWVVALLAQVLNSTDVPADRWRDAWTRLAVRRSLDRRKKGGSRHAGTSEMLVYVGAIAVALSTWSEEVDGLWQRVVGSAIELAATKATGTQTEEWRTIARCAATAAALLPDPEKRVAEIVQYVAPDPELTAQVVESLHLNGVPAERIRALFGGNVVESIRAARAWARGSQVDAFDRLIAALT